MKKIKWKLILSSYVKNYFKMDSNKTKNIDKFHKNIACRRIKSGSIKSQIYSKTYIVKEICLQP